MINLDFADVRVVMQSMGTALMGTGEAEGDQRALRAAEKAISNPLLDEVSMRDAKGLLISITGSFDMTLYEVEEAASRVRREVDPEANPRSTSSSPRPRPSIEGASGSVGRPDQMRAAASRRQGPKAGRSSR